jgi:hypothetical protein
MLREILLYLMRQRADVEIVEAGSSANLAATAQRTAPDVVAVGRPDSDAISAWTVLAVAPSARFVELSADGRSAVLYSADAAPRSFEGLGARSLLTSFFRHTSETPRRPPVFQYLPHIHAWLVRPRRHDVYRCRSGTRASRRRRSAVARNPLPLRHQHHRATTGKLVERLRGYGLEVSADDILLRCERRSSFVIAAAIPAAPYVPEATLEDLQGLDLVAGTTGRAREGARPGAVIIGDLGDLWTYELLQEAFGFLLDGAELVALSRDRYWLKGNRLVLDAGPSSRHWSTPPSRTARVTGKPTRQSMMRR